MRCQVYYQTLAALYHHVPPRDLPMVIENFNEFTRYYEEEDGPDHWEEYQRPLDILEMFIEWCELRKMGVMV